MKEYTVFPPKKKKVLPPDNKSKSNSNHDVLLLLREDGMFVQYGSAEDAKNDINEVVEGTSSLGTMQGSWALVDGQLILAADRPKDPHSIRSETSKHDTMMTGKVVATSGDLLKGNPALAKKDQNEAHDQNEDKSSRNRKYTKHGEGQEEYVTKNTNEDVHLSVSGEISIGKFFYPPKHPSFFDQPMFGPTPTGSFELKQILGNLNTQVTDEEDDLVEKFRKEDLVNKRYFLTSYPLPTKSERKKKQRWSIKGNKFVDAKAKSDADKEREEMEKNAPMPVKSFEVALFANNTFSSITGLGDTVLRGKWSIVGERRDQLWMNVWRFGFGRNVSGSTYSEGPYLSHLDDVSYWGEIYELDGAVEEDNIEDDPAEWKGTRIEINGAVMIGVGLEPCSIARFTMIEKTEDDFDYDDDDDDDDETDEEYDGGDGNFADSISDSKSNAEEDDDNSDELPFDIGSFE